MESNLDPVGIALQYVGKKDDPIYNNWFYAKEGIKAACCGTFVSFCRDKGGMPLGIIDYLRGYASVPFAVNFFKKNNKIVDTPQRNDLCFFDWDGHKTNFTHTGLFIKDNGDGSFQTAEANTSANGSQGMGGNTMEKRRFYNLAIFARP